MEGGGANMEMLDGKGVMKMLDGKLGGQMEMDIERGLRCKWVTGGGNMWKGYRKGDKI